MAGRRGRRGRDSASWPRCCRRSWCCPASRRPIWSPGIVRCGRRARRPAWRPPRRWWCPAGGISLLVELWPASSRPYIGGSQHNSIIELTLGYNGLGRLTGNETGGLGNLNHDVGWGRLFGTGMGLDIAWLLPAAVICLAAGFILTRRAPRTDPTRAALIIWGGWLVVTAAVFSFVNGIVHPVLHGGARAGDRRVHRHRCNTVVAEPLRYPGRDRDGRRGARHRHPRRGVAVPARRVDAVAAGRVAVGGVAAAALLLVARPVAADRRAVGRGAGGRVVSGRARGVFGRDRGVAAQRRDTVGRARAAALRRRFAGPGGLLDSPKPGPGSVGDVAATPTTSPGPRRSSARTTPRATNWPAGTGDGGRRVSTAPTPHRRSRSSSGYVAARQIHYFIRGTMMHGQLGRHRTAAAGGRRHRANGCETHYTPSDRRPRGRLRPHAAAEELIAGT